MIKNDLKIGDKVKFLDGDENIYIIYAIYSDTMVSLGLADYPDTEQDYQVHFREVLKIA